MDSEKVPSAWCALADSCRDAFSKRVVVSAKGGGSQKNEGKQSDSTGREDVVASPA